jgi:hypothetical protein
MADTVCVEQHADASRAVADAIDELITRSVARRSPEA